ncbi:LRR receptor-like serine/threonine-protein kinase FLS2 [Vigna unguiculata]|uniref:LRR receptor-like serine/threonine-protein kinase FLS2 n=1 Tax=Vigna unguiculata TaxID=3917 RepID=A0A4D6NF47_VIGUN|nr:LRR receptor-like serine/threonine-protein kinase FLS2 [Vigna unguiculata]
MKIHQIFFNIFIPLCLICFNFNILVVTCHCLHHDQFLLLQLKQNLVFNPNTSTKLVHWNESSDCCQWNGVTCSMGHVTGLDLSEEFISGELHNSTLFQLHHLLHLNLAYNDFSSSIPLNFDKLKNLRSLNFSSCRLSGHFPKGIFQIQTLNVLDVSNNKDLHGALPNFQEDDAVLLHTMNLSNTNFSGKLPGSISNLKQLSVLDLSNCQFIETLPISMSELTQLVYLDLSFNKFTGSLPSFRMVKNLRYLSLAHNSFTGTISTHFEGLENLLIINLGDNFLGGKIPVSLFTLPSLQELTLSHNGFHGPLDEFSNVSSSKLQLIDLSSNSLEGTIPVSIFHQELRFLQLSANQFSGTIELDRIQRLQSLHTLGLSHNNLSVDITLIDEHDISSFPNMKYLLLGSCKLGEFPGFLRNHPQLHALDLSNNQIHGIIPNWIWRFDSLVYLNLSNNFLTTMEGPFDDLHSKLYILDLHSNQLLGSIPTFTEYAVHLDYSSNNFSTFPLDLNNYIPFVHYLSLSNNNFQGKIHETFCNFTYLRLLDLSYNTFNGFIPKCLTTKNSTLRVLNLAGNKLQGSISDTISRALLRSWTKMIGNQTESQEEQGTLFFDMFDNHDNIRYNTLFSVINEFLVLKLFKLLSTEPYTVADHIFAYYVTSNQFGGRYLDSVTIVSKAKQMQWIKIPSALTSLDLSCNHFQGLCGPPLKDCSNGTVRDSAPTPVYEMHGSIELNFLSVELGFIFGFGIFILPLMLLKKWRLLYWQIVDNFLERVVPQLDFVYEHCEGKRYKSLRWMR